MNLATGFQPTELTRNMHKSAKSTDRYPEIFGVISRLSSAFRNIVLEKDSRSKEMLFTNTRFNHRNFNTGVTPLSNSFELLRRGRSFAFNLKDSPLAGPGLTSSWKRGAISRLRVVGSLFQITRYATPAWGRAWKPPWQEATRRTAQRRKRASGAKRKASGSQDLTPNRRLAMAALARRLWRCPRPRKPAPDSSVSFNPYEP